MAENLKTSLATDFIAIPPGNNPKQEQRSLERTANAAVTAYKN